MVHLEPLCSCFKIILHHFVIRLIRVLYVRPHWGQGGSGGSSYVFSIALVDLPRSLAYFASEIPLKAQA